MALTETKARPGAETGGERWRNWWLLSDAQTFTCVVCGHEVHVEDGQTLTVAAHCKTYPSVAAATEAARALDGMSDPECGREWLGAYPDGERPK